MQLSKMSSSGQIPKTEVAKLTILTVPANLLVS